MPQAPLQIASSKYLLVIVSVVVLFFLISTGVSQYHVAKIEGLVRDSVGNALPSAARLSEARSHLRDLLNTADKLAARHTGAGAADLRRQILNEEQDLRASFLAYQDLPQFPSEGEVERVLAVQLGEFSRTLKAFVNDGTITSSAPIRAQGTLLDRGFSRVIEFDLSQGHRLALEISSIRSESLVLSVVLDTICVALAVVAATIAVRIKNASDRLMKERAEELEGFAFRVAHDLKNPLGAIKLSSELASFPSSEEERTLFMNKIGDASSSMAVLIDGLLNFARSGAQPEPGAKADLGGAIDAVMLWAKPEAERAKIRLHAPAASGIKVSCSEAVLNSVLSNLVRNALKFVRDGDSGSPAVSIDVREMPARVRLEISDNGPGVPADKVESIFAPYFRGNHKHAGIGLGLATVKRLVESHGGAVGVVSQPGQGSRFWIELPSA